MTGAFFRRVQASHSLLHDLTEPGLPSANASLIPDNLHELTNMSKPSIILIPASFALPELYDPIVDAVAANGYEIQALHLPTVGLKTGPREGAPPSMYEDATFIATEVEKLSDEGKDVILIAHSYGGIPATESTKGLGKEEREKDGKKGGVVALAYITAVVPAVGDSAMGVLASVPPESQLELPIDVRFSPLPVPVISK